MVPYEATALRLVARMIRERQGLLSTDVCNVNLLTGLTWTSVVNLLGVDLLILGLSAEICGAVAAVGQWFTMTEEEWREYEKENEGKDSRWWVF